VAGAISRDPREIAHRSNLAMRARPTPLRRRDAVTAISSTQDAGPLAKNVKLRASKTTGGFIGSLGGGVYSRRIPSTLEVETIFLERPGKTPGN